jgi:Ca2+-binding EF-hand superfamily protein
LENLGVVNENDDEYMEYFNKIDRDQKGFISYEEFEQDLYDCYDGDSPDNQE